MYRETAENLFGDVFFLFRPVAFLKLWIKFEYIYQLEERNAWMKNRIEIKWNIKKEKKRKEISNSSE